jgi:hypothetical protein
MTAMAAMSWLPGRPPDQPEPAGSPEIPPPARFGR